MNLADILLNAKKAFCEEVSTSYQIEIGGTNAQDATVTSYLNNQKTVTKMSEWLMDKNNETTLRNALTFFAQKNKDTYAKNIYDMFCKNSSNEQSYQQAETDALNNTAFHAKGVNAVDAKKQQQANTQTMSDMTNARFNDVLKLITNSNIQLLIRIALLVFGKAEQPIDINALNGQIQKVNYDGTL